MTTVHALSAVVTELFSTDTHPLSRVAYSLLLISLTLVSESFNISDFCFKFSLIALFVCNFDFRFCSETNIIMHYFGVSVQRRCQPTLGA